MVNGRMIRLSGNESTAYMQKAADYVNAMYAKLRKLPGFTSKSHDYQTLMMYMNFADEYLQQTGWKEEKQVEADKMARDEISRLKREAIDRDHKYEELSLESRRTIDELKQKAEGLEAINKRLSEREKDLQSRLDLSERELSAYKTEISVLRQKAADTAKSAEEADRQVKEAFAKERQLRILTKQYETQMEEQKAGFDKEYASLQADYDNQLAEMRADYENKLAEARAGYEDQLSRHESDDSELIEYLDLIEDKDREIASLRSKLMDYEGNHEE